MTPGAPFLNRGDVAREHWVKNKLEFHGLMPTPYGIGRAEGVAMITAIALLSGLLAVGFLMGLCIAYRAPFGYQDENGFHFGVPLLPH